jgi:hypothetical protein
MAPGAKDLQKAQIHFFYLHALRSVHDAVCMAI